MFGRDRRQERREERREARTGGPVLTHYQMRQRMISIGDDYVIENDRGERVFKLDGKALRIRKTVRFEDRHGRELCRIQERMLHLKDSMEIEDPSGHQIGMVKKALITPLRDRWIVKIKGGPDLEVQGNILDHELCKIQERMLRVKDSMEIEDPGGRRMALVQKAMITPVRERWTVKVDGPDLQVQGNIVDHEYTIERAGQRVAEVSKRWFRVRDTYGVEVAPGENDILSLATTAVIDTMAHPDR